ncbi:MAG: DUF4166 domain-containing protein [Paracoccaceae bacterium]
MKILLLGGTGVFGSRLARLLVRDMLTVTIAGRNVVNAQALADELNCSALRMDRSGDLSELNGFDVVIDAAGPYHAYGEDPYRLVRAAIQSGVHYLDLCDNAAFCSGIQELDAEAKAAGVCAISGMSSVPALSSAVVCALAQDDVPISIDTAILPGNRSPRGLSVMASILSQVGRPMKVFRAGRWIDATGWSAPRRYRLPEGLSRQGWLIEVPDVALFPKHFGAQTVVFRAGLELGAMRYGLWFFALLRRWIPIPINGPVLRFFKLAADLLAPYGSDRGGMSVDIYVGQERRWWRLLVEEGDGPYIPTIAIRALLRRTSLPLGAGPALETITLAEAEAAMSDLKVRSERGTEVVQTIFQDVLGAEFEKLPETIRATHMTKVISRWRGKASVRRGQSTWSKLLGWGFGFPASVDDIQVEVIKTVTRSGETWERRFGERRFKSYLAPNARGMTERFGPFTFRLGLKVVEGCLYYPVISGRIGLLPMPRWLLPTSDAREYEKNGRFHFDVKLSAPFTNKLLVHYQGELSAVVPEF